MEYFGPDWCSLPWSPWIPFTAERYEFRDIPREPGLYRIRPAGKDFLMYIGETRRTVDERLSELRLTLNRTEPDAMERSPHGSPFALGMEGRGRFRI